MNTRIFNQNKVSHYTIDLAVPQGKEKSAVPLISLLEVKPTFPRRKRKAGEEYFGRYNIFAYSFPENTLNIDTIFKLTGQMFLYLTDIMKAKDNDLPETTFCLMLNEKPENLLKQLEELDIEVVKKGGGIYYAKFPFRFKILVASEMSDEESITIHSLLKYLEKKHK